MFANAIGGPIDASNLRSWHYALLRRAQLPRIHFHDLRHTTATLLLSNGADIKAVSEMLGHSSVAITLLIYYHVMPHRQQQVTNTMDALLREAQDAQGSNRGSDAANGPGEGTADEA